MAEYKNNAPIIFIWSIHLKNITDLKNSIIQARFETKELGVSITKYQVKFKSGKSCTMLCMDGLDLHSATLEVFNQFGMENIQSIE